MDKKVFTNAQSAQAFYDSLSGDKSIGTSKVSGEIIVMFEAAEQPKEVGVEIFRVADGFFRVTFNGEATEYNIINTSRGWSGTKNLYGVFKGKEAKLTGVTLSRCKKAVKSWLA